MKEMIFAFKMKMGVIAPLVFNGYTPEKDVYYKNIYTGELITAHQYAMIMAGAAMIGTILIVLVLVYPKNKD